MTVLTVDTKIKYAYLVVVCVKKFAPSIGIPTEMVLVYRYSRFPASPLFLLYHVRSHAYNLRLTMHQHRNTLLTDAVQTHMQGEKLASIACQVCLGCDLACLFTLDPYAPRAKRPVQARQRCNNWYRALDH